MAAALVAGCGGAPDAPDAPARPAASPTATPGAKAQPVSVGAVAEVASHVALRPAAAADLRPLLEGAARAVAGTVLGMRIRRDACGAHAEVRLAVEASLGGRHVLLQGDAEDDEHDVRFVVTDLAEELPAGGPAPGVAPAQGRCEQPTTRGLTAGALRSGDRIVVALARPGRTEPAAPPWRRADRALVVAPITELPRLAAALPRPRLGGDDEQDLPVPRVPGVGTPRSRDRLAGRERFEPRGEEVVDHALGVVWQRATAPRPLHLFEAAWSCDALRLGGHDGWRLPTAVELQGLLEPGGAPPALRRRDRFPTTGELMWTRTDDDGSWVGALDGGALISTHYDDPHPYGPYVTRCVREGDAPRTLARDRFAADGDTLRDLLSGLVWHLPPSPPLLSQAAARRACQESRAAGRDDWRLPSPDEAFALMSGCPRQLASWGAGREDDEVWTDAVDRASGHGLVHEVCDLARTVPLAAVFPDADEAGKPPVAVGLCVRDAPSPPPLVLPPCPAGTVERRAALERRCERDGVVHGPYQTFYPSGAPFETSRFEGGRRSGPFVVHHEHGGTWLEGSFVDGALDGELLVSRPGERRRSTQRFVRGVPQGTWTWNDVAGGVVETLAWADGRPGAGVITRVIGHEGARSTCPTAGGLEHGTEVSSDADGVYAEVTHVAGTPEGPAVFRPQGSGERRGSHRDGLRHGVWIDTRADGTLESRSVLSDGVLDGTLEIFEADGKSVQRRHTFANGRRVGPFELRDGTGRVSVRGELDAEGTGRVVDLGPDGKVRREQPFVKGAPHGLARTYDEHGRVVREETWKDGQRDGPWRELRPDGSVESLVTYRRGVLHGPVRETAPDGTELRVGSHVDGKRDGPWVVTLPTGARVRATFVDGRPVAGSWSSPDGAATAPPR